MDVHCFTGSPVSRPTKSTFSKLCLAILLFSVLSCVTGYEMQASNDAFDSELFKRMAEMGEIHIDRRAPPPLPLRARDSTTTPSAITSSISAINTASGTQTRSANHTTTGSASASTITGSHTAVANSTSLSPTSTSSTSTFTTPSAYPTPFDTSLGNNFTASSCPAWFNNFIVNNSTFDGCSPVSLLLQNSLGFFKAARSAKYMNSVLDNSCGAPLALCSPLMSSLATQLISDSNCGPDFRRQNPIVLQAYNGLLAYEPLYNATCLQNQNTGNYCLTDAITNTSNAFDMYPYYTALGLPLTANSNPTCNSCLQRTMNVFAGYAQQKNQPLAKTYLGCATQIDGTCGPSFANTQVKVAVTSNTNFASRSVVSSTTLSMVTLMLTCFLLFQ